MANSSTNEHSIQNIGVLGAGQMGASAATLFRRAGLTVRLWTRNEAKLNESVSAIHAMDRFLDEHFGPSEIAAGELILEPRLVAVDATSDAVLECIAENMDQKAELLRQLRGCRDRGALVMSCTSALSITEMARQSDMEDVLVGAHFWNPPHLIPVVEIIAGRTTPRAKVDQAGELMRRVGKLPVECTDVPGFIGNRLMHAMWREALAMIDAGICTPEAIDQVVKWTFALRLPVLGPIENMDLVGLKLVQSVESYLFPDLATNSVPAAALMSRLARGEGGMNSGRGFYDWSKRDSAATVELRDRQIVQQLKFLRSQGVFDGLLNAPEPPTS